nr:uncharacterized protein LOC118878525 [Drosophila suzukii]
MTMKKKEIPLRVSRWAMYLQDFDYEIEHRSGSKMRHVDALSRVSCYTLTDSLFHRLREAQLLDDWTKVLKSVVKIKGYEDFYIVNEFLFEDPNKELLIFPSLMETEIIQNSHKKGHFSSNKTEDLIEKSFYIPKLKDKVIVSDRGAAFTSHLFKEYCDTIAECMKAFGTNPASGGPILGCGTGETMTTRSGLTY